MFGFALHDLRRGAVWIARDRLGVKPLFYARMPRGLAFASDIHALAAAYPTEVDSQLALRYLALGFAAGDSTVWRGVHKLLPAHDMWIEGGNITIRKYWSLPDTQAYTGTLEQAAGALDHLLTDAIRLQLRSDVPLGVFLSGGLDSSTIVALAASQVPGPLRTYTVCFEGKASSDAQFSRLVAERYGTEHVEIPMGPADAVAALDRLLPMLDEPVADSAMLPAFYLSAMAHDAGIKVLLNGAGGDEIFGGYRRHSPPRRGSPAWVAECFPGPMRALASGLWSRVDANRGVRAGDPALAWGASVNGQNFAAARAVLGREQDYRALLDTIRSTYSAVTSSSGRGNRADGYAHSRMAVDVATYLPENVLSLTDKATMAASVEGRVPLLDHRLVEFAFSLPADISMPGGAPKGLLKRIMADRLPAPLLNRRKEGFNAPDDVWLRDDSRFDMKGELLDGRTPVVDALVEPRALERLLADPAKRADAASLLFSLYLLNRWHRAQLARR
jgi:asparagine synthase (glutamine-hydrolysing)